MIWASPACFVTFMQAICSALAPAVPNCGNTIEATTNVTTVHYGTTWDDSSQGAELYDGFIAAAVAEAITEDAA